jgi:hypothetical protein
MKYSRSLSQATIVSDNVNKNYGLLIVGGIGSNG